MDDSAGEADGGWKGVLVRESLPVVFHGKLLRVFSVVSFLHIGVFFYLFIFSKKIFLSETNNIRGKRAIDENNWKKIIDDKISNHLSDDFSTVTSDDET